MIGGGLHKKKQQQTKKKQTCARWEERDDDDDDDGTTTTITTTTTTLRWGDARYCVDYIISVRMANAHNTWERTFELVHYYDDMPFMGKLTSAPPSVPLEMRVRKWTRTLVKPNQRENDNINNNNKTRDMYTTYYIVYRPTQSHRFANQVHQSSTSHRESYFFLGKNLNNNKYTTVTVFHIGAPKSCDFKNESTVTVDWSHFQLHRR